MLTPGTVDCRCGYDGNSYHETDQNNVEFYIAVHITSAEDM